ncbi:MAG TPA: FliA/WhiG family RNA polymerase sigma factor [Gemmatimonadales bacterium]|jgi:RNA polymerase sigma factor for flagellar operon FliA|nr:FliA/WhiG family RNA polymerase sigma factor [Gemmatimonadales bacterium]
MTHGVDLWARLRDRRDGTARDALVRQHLPLVRRLAYDLSRRLPSSVEVDELVSAGSLGLLQAIDRFEPSRGLAFSTFATPRIRGAMLDALRASSHAPRAVRVRRRQVAAAAERLTARLGRAPDPQEMAAALALDAETYGRWVRDIAALEAVPLDLAEAERFLTVAGGEAEEGPMSEALEAALARLPERERQVLALYYFEDLPQREIARVLGVTESRVSQLHTRAVHRLREILTGLRGARC